jgi:ferredoxin-NADP reductase
MPLHPARPVCRLLGLALLAAGVGLVAGAPAPGQVPPGEHEKHHAGAGGPGTAGERAGGMGMGGEHGGATPPKELYPSLMSLPDLSPERRAEVQRQAHERMQAGAALMSQGLDRLSNVAAGDDYAAMQEATAQVREGLALFGSGLAAHRALAEGKAPGDVALEWFKREMSLSPPASAPAGGGPFGLSWLHLAVMALLAGFAAVMLWMYFHKMRRAAELLKRLTVSAAPAAAAGAAPITSNAPAGAETLPPDPVARGRAPGPAALPSATPSREPGPPEPGRWSGRLRVARVFEETPGVKTFRLMAPEGGPVPFSYLPGQFLTLTVAPDGKPVNRSYTMASSPTQRDHLEITVKREQQGLVSRYLHDRVKPGDEVEVAAPSGSFTFTGREGDSIVLIGGGVGITPLMSVVRYLTDRAWPGDVYLLNCCRTSRDFVFRDELEHLQRRHLNLHVVATMTRAAGTAWMGPTGRFTKELLARSVPEIAARRVHLCGPPPMMAAVQALLAELGVPREQVKTEVFGPARGPAAAAVSPQGGGQARAQAEQKAAAGGAGVLPATVTFARSGKSAPLAPDGTVLEAAEAVGVEIPTSCRAGTCGTCKVRLLSGTVTMEVADGLTPEDKAWGFVLACQARAHGDVEVEA